MNNTAIRCAGLGGWLHIHLLLLALCLTSACGHGPQGEAIPDVDPSYLFTEPRAFLHLTNGISLSEAQQIHGYAGRHVFTAARGQTNYLLSTHYFANGASMSALFANERFDRFTRSECSDQLREAYSYHGAPATRLRPWTIQQADKLCVEPTLQRSPLSREEVRRVITAEAVDDSSSEKPQLPPAFVKALFEDMGPAIEHRLREEHQINQSLLDRFDGRKVAVDMVIDQVDSLFGEPIQTADGPDGQEVRVYGKDVELSAVNRLYQFRGVAVLFRDGSVTHVFSNGFVCEDWLAGKNIFSLEGGDRPVED